MHRVTSGSKADRNCLNEARPSTVYVPHRRRIDNASYFDGSAMSGKTFVRWPPTLSAETATFQG
jgi:hypothetical protein